MEKKLIISLFVAIAAISSAGAQTCVPHFKCGPYGAVVILSPVDGQAPFTYKVCEAGDTVVLESNVLFLPYGQRMDVYVSDACHNLAISRLELPSTMKNFFDPADIEVDDQEIHIYESKMIVINGVMCGGGDTTISRPSSGWVKVVGKSIPWIDTVLFFDTVSRIDTVRVGLNTPNANMRIYPNPTSGPLSIESTKAIRKLTIFNDLGQHVFTNYNLGSMVSMDLTTLPKGIYTMRITLNDGDGRESVYKLVRN